MCIYTYICMCIYICVYTYIYVCIYICVYINIYMRVYIYTYVCVFIYIYIYICVCVFIYIYIYIYVCVCIYIHISTDHNTITYIVFITVTSGRISASRRTPPTSTWSWAAKLLSWRSRLTHSAWRWGRRGRRPLRWVTLIISTVWQRASYAWIARRGHFLQTQVHRWSKWSPRKAQLVTKVVNTIKVTRSWTTTRSQWNLMVLNCQDNHSLMPQPCFSLKIHYRWKVWGHPDNFASSMKNHTFIYQMNIKCSQDIEKVRNND